MFCCEAPDLFCGRQNFIDFTFGENLSFKAKFKSVQRARVYLQHRNFIFSHVNWIFSLAIEMKYYQAVGCFTDEK